MCGILGVFEDDGAIQRIIKGIDVLRNRGMDGFGITSGENTVHYTDYGILDNPESKEQLVKRFFGQQNGMAHVLHAIVGEVQQPFVDSATGSWFVSNNEIYNWTELAKSYGVDAVNDSELLFTLLERTDTLDQEKIVTLLSALDGVYAFAYKTEGYVICARDIMGVKPLWYTTEKGFAFASERKALLKMGYRKMHELNPRDVLIHSFKNDAVTLKRRPFYTVDKTHSLSYESQRQRVYTRLKEAVKKRVPDKPFGVLFSGGVDSAALCHLLQELQCSFTCYIAALDEEGLAASQDLEVAKEAAKEMGLTLKVVTVTLSDVPEYLAKIIPLIEDTNVVKVGVALPFFLACEKARQDGIKVLFSGLGSEEIFGGYQRHKQSLDINTECVSGLLKMYERDLYRDDVVTMYNRIELRLPFLDRELVSYALQIPSEFKIKDEFGKYILHDAMYQNGLSSAYAWRPKKAAQYGSRFDKAIEKLTRREGLQEKSTYLRRFSTIPNPKLCALVSSGKDGMYAAYIMQKQNYEIACFLSMVSKNTESYMYHTPNISLVHLQAEAADIPLIVQETEGEKEEELEDLKAGLRRAQDNYGIEGVVTGALYSNYQRQRIEGICDELGLKIFSPLWHIDQTRYMKQLLRDGFVVTLSSVAAEGLDASWLMRLLDEEMIRKLISIDTKIGINVAFEGGEAESLVLDCPLFSKRIEIIDSEIKKDGSCSAQLLVHDARLVDK